MKSRESLLKFSLVSPFGGSELLQEWKGQPGRAKISSGEFADSAWPRARIRRRNREPPRVPVDSRVEPISALSPVPLPTFPGSVFRSAAVRYRQVEFAALPRASSVAPSPGAEGRRRGRATRTRLRRVCPGKSLKGTAAVASAGGSISESARRWTGLFSKAATMTIKRRNYESLIAETRRHGAYRTLRTESLKRLVGRVL